MGYWSEVSKSKSPFPVTLKPSSPSYPSQRVLLTRNQASKYMSLFSFRLPQPAIGKGLSGSYVASVPHRSVIKITALGVSFAKVYSCLVNLAVEV